MLDSLNCFPDSKAQDSGFQKQNFPEFQILQAKISQILESRFSYMGQTFTLPKWYGIVHLTCLDLSDLMSGRIFYVLIYNKVEFSSLINDKSIGILQCMENLKKRRKKTGYEIFRKEILLWHLVHERNFFYFLHRIIQSRFIRSVWPKKKLILPPNLTRNSNSFSVRMIVFF